ncbi:Protein of unknown function (DUF3592) [Polaromonas sp. CF318]|uniref:DUF3592 domain-containing protein n=1 Tax=Polaromonas sp. CF318 TaxID=1144318 RepID=UPI000270F20E|nr:DUF3592 domain-containing protein [Polaromonas sp. CF318]EJL85117.1 Protein of unknown function (DUF3592) [Polaromonas sp. CF318]
MYAAAVAVVLSLAAALVLLAGVVVAAKQAAFLRASYSVNGRVISEWRYRMHGRNRRYYRVQLRLSNGQSVELRSAVTGSPNAPPHVGETVPVRVREAEGKVSAKIGTRVELWFVSFVLLFMGGVGCLVMFVIVRSMLLAGAF